MKTLLLAGPVELRAAAGGKPRRFEILAYTGGILHVDGFDRAVVLDLAGLEAAGSGGVPIVLDHRTDVDNTLGITDGIQNTGRELILSGTVTGNSPKVLRVLAQADAGHSWQASVGCRVMEVEPIEPSQRIIVNGQSFTGPIYVARSSILRETSVLPAGADAQTTVNLAAAAAISGVKTMPTFEEWLASLGLDVATMAPEALAELQKAYDAMTAAPSAEAAATIDLQARQDALARLRASRPKAPHARIPESGVDERSVLEAALTLNAGIPERFVGRFHDQQTMNAAVSSRYRKTGLHDVLFTVIRAAGKTPLSHRVDAETIRTAFEADRMLRASGFSTISLPGIMSNSMNKVLLNAYESVETTWRAFCAVESNSDFKAHSRYRLTGNGAFQQIGATGELKHFSLSEESYSNQLETHGSIISITRKMIIDDDLSAMAQVPTIIGRQAAIKVEKSVYTLLLSNPGSPAFFSTDNANFISGATTNLSIDSLTLAEQRFLDMVDENGDPVMVSPKILLVPTSIHTTGRQILSTVTTVTDAADSVPNSNPFAGRFQLAVSPWLNSQNLSGSSSTAWYLLTGGGDVSIMEVAFLNGQESPTVESGDTDFNTLGVQMRGYFDFGVGMRDPRAGVRSKGAV